MTKSLSDSDEIAKSIRESVMATLGGATIPPEIEASIMSLSSAMAPKYPKTPPVDLIEAAAKYMHAVTSPKSGTTPGVFIPLDVVEEVVTDSHLADFAETYGLKLHMGASIAGLAAIGGDAFCALFLPGQIEYVSDRDCFWVPVKSGLTANSTRVSVSSGIGSQKRKHDERELTMAKKAVKDAALEFRMNEARTQWEDIAQAIKFGQRTLLWGPPGTGKSRIGTHGVENFHRIYLTLETPAAEIRGHYLVGETGTHWHNGPATMAWLTGGRLQIEEVDQASGDCLSWLLGVLDDPDTAYLTLPNNERIYPKEGFSAVATTNESPNMIPGNLLDRFDTIINVTLPNPAAFDQPWSDEDLCEAAKRAIYLPDNRPKTTGGRQIGLRAFLAIDRMLGKGAMLADASRYVLGNETGQWLCKSMTLAAIAA